MRAKEIVTKMMYPAIALLLLLLMGSWLFKTETIPVDSNQEEQLADKDFNSNSKLIIEERHIGMVKLDTLRALITEIGWNDKVKIKVRRKEVSFLLESLEDKNAYNVIFLDKMSKEILESRVFEEDPFFTIVDEGDDYGLKVKYLKKDGVEYVAMPFDFLLGITDERDRQKAGN